MGNSVASTQNLNHLTQTFGVCTATILLKYIITIFWAANTADHPPEDTVSLGPLPPPPPADELKRRQRALANDMENLPLHLIVFWATYLLQIFALPGHPNGTKASVRALQALFIIYTISRVLYTVCYALSLQPWRTVFFTTALSAVGATAVLLVFNSFKVNL